jgi:hypothetical protein
MLTVYFQFGRKDIMRNQTVTCDFCGRAITGPFVVVEIKAGNAELVTRVPELRDACPECSDRINEVGREAVAFAPGAAADRSDVGTDAANEVRRQNGLTSVGTVLWACTMIFTT